MPRIGYHASHEQFAPSTLLDLVARAEAAGFRAAMCSDHLFPWSERQGHSGFTWSWLGAAMQATTLPYGVVTAPVQRYHPAVAAQAIATIGEMFPGRFWAALGSGQALNEHVTGEPWPPKPLRNKRLAECAEVIRALLSGETVDHDGLVTVRQARLYSRPAEQPALFVAALTPETARTHASWADGLITVNQPPDALRKLLAAFREAGGDGKPAYLQVHLSWARTDEEALAQAHDQWRGNIFPGHVLEDIAMPEQFDAIAEQVHPEALRGPVLVSADMGRHCAWLAELLELGFDAAYVHNVGRNQEPFIDAFASTVLPELGEA